MEDASWDNHASSPPPPPSVVLLLPDAFAPFSDFPALEEEADGGSATFKSSLAASHIPSQEALRRYAPWMSSESCDPGTWMEGGRSSFAPSSFASFPSDGLLVSFSSTGDNPMATRRTILPNSSMDMAVFLPNNGSFSEFVVLSFSSFAASPSPGTLSVELPLFSLTKHNVQLASKLNLCKWYNRSARACRSLNSSAVEEEEEALRMPGGTMTARMSAIFCSVEEVPPLTVTSSWMRVLPKGEFCNAFMEVVHANGL
mmetsp:Transcript_34380/g.72430  ORF Transcript_34380/g.72430 Transcript_34380/m.72430 type:complete len:257 (-) Transcript_34380:1270-2040(-)